MNEAQGGSVDGGSADAGGEPVTVRCTADALDHDLDVPWTRGAIFELESLDTARRWVADQNGGVPGTLFLARAPDPSGPLAVDYYLKYNAPK